MVCGGRHSTTQHILNSSTIAKLIMPSLRTCALLLMAATTSTAFTPSPYPPSAAVRCEKYILFSSNSNNNIDNHDFDDFAEFSSTQLASSSSSMVDNNSDDDSFLSSLQSRVQQVQHQSNKLVSTFYHTTMHLLAIIIL